MRSAHRTTWPARLRRTLLALLVATAVIAPVSAAAQPQIPAPAPAAASLTLPTRATLQTTYRANRANAEAAARMAEAHGDRSRAATDRSMAAPSRQFLSFDGRGPGRTVEVFGDLLKADHIAVLVPGSDTSLDTYDRFQKAAQALHAETGPGTAVIAWLGYKTPGTISTTVLTPTRAEQAAPHLRTFVHELRGLVGGSADVSLVCHSYGSVVCGRAVAGLDDVDDIVMIGSPGAGVDSAAALDTSAQVWAARGTDDWIEMVPHTQADFFGTTIGFGTDPTSPAFGAHVFPAGDAGHSDYFAPGSLSLKNLAHITRGTPTETPDA
ncbi:alpha/beta hydrolase [Streptomyces ipomoeae]|nr:alpha/beta hydrolase [Streptomyces ipomoeae]MDX2936844.1 alpha/beta hydrolase [Streptomyces ipomoeae]